MFSVKIEIKLVLVLWRFGLSNCKDYCGCEFLACSVQKKEKLFPHLAEVVQLLKKQNRLKEFTSPHKNQALC